MFAMHGYIKPKIVGEWVHYNGEKPVDIVVFLAESENYYNGAHKIRWMLPSLQLAKNDMFKFFNSIKAENLEEKTFVHSLPMEKLRELTILVNTFTNINKRLFFQRVEIFEDLEIRRIDMKIQHTSEDYLNPYQPETASCEILSEF